MPHIKINHRVVVFDAADLEAESRFRASVLGGTVDAEDGRHMVLADGEPRVAPSLRRTTCRRLKRG